MTELKITCSNCSTLLIVQHDAIVPGKRIMCPKCLSPFYPKPNPDTVEESTDSQGELQITCSNCQNLFVMKASVAQPGRRIMCPKCLTPFYPDSVTERIASPIETHRSEELPLEFHGSAKEYFRIWIVNLCLTLVTLGLFSAWAKVRKKRYMYSHTTLDGTPFQYLAKPFPILKGRLIAVVGFLIWWVCSRFFTSFVPVVIGIGLIAAPWVLVRSAAFNARYSAYRNMTFDFDAGYAEGVNTLYVWGIIPVFVLSMMVPWQATAILAGIASLVFGLYFPYWIRRLRKFILERTSYGGVHGVFSATGGQFFSIYFLSGLIMAAAVVPVVVVVIIIVMQTKDKSMLTWAGAAPAYLGYVLAFAYIKARTTNLTWNHTRFGPLVFKSTMRSRDLIKLYFSNAIGIVLSMGILIPWAVMRTVRYRADHMQVFQEGPMETFQGSENKTVAAAGAETMDFFDLDLAI